jgi:hypothetical protein
MSAPLVVAALQAPTLLNIWARSEKWRLVAAPLGDHEGLAEAELLAPDLRQPISGKPDVVLVCSPAQLKRAREMWPDAKHVWVLHNSTPGYLPSAEREQIAAAVALTDQVKTRHELAWKAQGGSIPRVQLIIPYFEPMSRWGWARHRLWSMVSRPETRHPEHLFGIQEVLSHYALHERHTLYGQGQPGGFLDPRAKQAVIAACSAYISHMPEWAGFGLAEHEMLAAGVPVIGRRWADLRTDLSEEYTGLTDSVVEQASVAAYLSESIRSCWLGKGLSLLGLQFIADRRTRRQMDEGIEAFLQGVL